MAKVKVKGCNTPNST